MSGRLGLVAFVAIGSACYSPPGAWFRADKPPTADDRYAERFEPITLDAQAGCEPVLARQGEQTRPIIVLVHGIGGEGDEMHQAVPVLAASKPAAMFMVRYGPFEKRDVIAERLASGITHLARCIPGAAGRLIVLAHSAGGVVASLAAARVTAPETYDGDWLTVITVASPLAGTGRFPVFGDPAERPLMRELGFAISSYPEHAPGVRVMHLRTSAASDEFMRPSGDHVPNDPKVGVPGAAQIDLPAELDHPGSLVYVAKRIADGSWVDWLKP